MSERSDNMDFEAEVRRVAEAAWGLEPGECAPNHYEGNSIIRELDGYARTREIVHLIMVTVSRKLEKAKSDIKKLNAAEGAEKTSDIPVKKWLITRHQLEAEHIAFARKNNVTVRTFEQFQRMFFDSGEYIKKRRNANFGSARNLNDGSGAIPDDEYVEPVITVERLDISGKSSGVARIKLNNILEMINNGEVVLLVAPFGSGKSITVKQLFNIISKKVLRDGGMTPLVLNLREHWGQVYPDEIMERHARSIGFSPKENINVAWRAGMAHIFLDGFDEMAGQAIARVGDANFMRQARARALNGIKSVIQSTKPQSGVLVAGRDHYFDDLDEASFAMGLTGRKINVVRIEEFSENQANEYLKKRGVEYKLPEWLPRKPLLLGYLAHNNLLSEVVEIDSSLGFGYAWDRFLTLICNREAEHEMGAVEPKSLRKILEYLSCLVRATSSGNGPVSGKDLSDAYVREIGYGPDERVIMQLQRLPGLTQRDQEKGARSFVDADMLASLQGSFIASCILGESEIPDDRSWQFGLSNRAIETALFILTDRTNQDYKNIYQLLLSGCKNIDRNFKNSRSGMQMLCDYVCIAIETAREAGIHIDFDGIVIEGAYADSLNLEELKISGLRFKDCIIRDIYVSSVDDHLDVIFDKCVISRVNGILPSSKSGEQIFKDCEIMGFDELNSNSAIIKSGLSLRMKALITVLRKLFVQHGSGRKMNALKRGFGGSEIYDDIDKVVKYLESNGYIEIYNDVVYPKRQYMQRVKGILSEMQNSQDEIVVDLLN